MSNIQPLQFRRPVMLDYLDAIDEPLDVVVIGGGATGVSVALDSAARGYSTALLERGDFAGSTSSRSTKLIHGGVRYMRQGHLGLVRESLRERKLLMRNAPHLVHGLPILVPAYSRWQKLKYTAGLMSYSTISRGDGLGRAHRLSADSMASSAPGIQTDGLRGGVVYLDGQTDDARLALAIAKTAAAHGAALVNYVEVRALVVNNGRVAGVEAEDLLTGDQVRINAKVVINATGIHTDSTVELDPGDSRRLLRWSRGTHIVMDGSLLDGGYGLLVPEASDGRVIYALPWLGGTLVGTTDVNVESPDSDVEPPLEDIEFLVNELSRFLPEARRSRVLSAFTGIRPLVSNDPSSPTSGVSRSHRIVVSDSGLVTIAGGKWTTARLMAEQTVSKAMEVAGLPSSQSATSGLRLEGFERSGDGSNIQRSPVNDPDSLYGTEIAAITDLEKRFPELKEPLADGLPYRLSHAVHGMREEMAQTLEDLLARRTRAFFLDAGATTAAASRVAEVVERYAGLGVGWAERELAKLPESERAFRPPVSSE